MTASGAFIDLFATSCNRGYSVSVLQWRADPADQFAEPKSGI